MKFCGINVGKYTIVTWIRNGNMRDDIETHIFNYHRIVEFYGLDVPGNTPNLAYN